MSQLIQVRVNDQLTLDMGTLVEGGEHGGTILHPAVPLIEQVIAWLDRCPAVPDDQLDAVQLARATVAVCFRWGSWFALAADPALPMHRSQKDENRLTDAEQERLREDFTTALARWYDTKRSDPARLHQLAAKALAYLPSVPEAPKALPHVRSRKFLFSLKGLDDMRDQPFALALVTSPEGARAVLEAHDAENHDAVEVLRAEAYKDPMGMMARTIGHFVWELDNLKDAATGQPFQGEPLTRRYGTREAATEARRVIGNLAALDRYLERLFQERGRSWGEKAVAMGVLVGT